MKVYGDQHTHESTYAEYVQCMPAIKFINDASHIHTATRIHTHAHTRLIDETSAIATLYSYKTLIRV